MSEEERQTEVEIPDIIDDTEQYQENDYCSTEITDSELSIIKDSEEANPEEQCTSSEEQCTTSEQYQENEYCSTEITDSELSIIKDSEEANPEEQCTNSEKKTQNANKVEVIRSTRLPIARIKNIMKMDPDVTVVNAEAVFLVTKATEMFLETIAKETYAYTAQHKRKTIAKKDLDVVINKVDCLCFLEGAMDF